MNRIRRLSVAFAVAGVLGVAVPAAASALTTITISGATASYPLVSLLAQKYVKTAPAQGQVQDRPGWRPDRHQRRRRRPRHDRRRLARPARRATPPGSSSTRSPSTGSASSPTRPTRCSNLTSAQVVVDLHRQDAQLERQVPGATASGTIDLISRTSVAGVLTNFQTLLLEGKKVSTHRRRRALRGSAAASRSKTTPNSIGFVSNYQADKGGVNAVGFNGVACSAARPPSPASTRASHASTR